MAKVIAFKKSDKMILEEMKKDAMRELNQLYHLTGGFRFPTPPILDNDLMQAFYDGTMEF